MTFSLFILLDTRPRPSSSISPVDKARLFLLLVSRIRWREILRKRKEKKLFLRPNKKKDMFLVPTRARKSRRARFHFIFYFQISRPQTSPKRFCACAVTSPIIWSHYLEPQDNRMSFISGKPLSSSQLISKVELLSLMPSPFECLAQFNWFPKIKNKNKKCPPLANFPISPGRETCFFFIWPYTKFIFPIHSVFHCIFIPMRCYQVVNQISYYLEWLCMLLLLFYYYYKRGTCNVKLSWMCLAGYDLIGLSCFSPKFPIDWLDHCYLSSGDSIC